MFDNRVTTAGDLNTDFIRQLRTGVIERFRAFSQVGEYIQFRQGV